MGNLRQLVAWMVFFLIRGSSRLERRTNEAWKTYQPRLFVRWLYFLAFGTWQHLYETLEGVELAVARRSLLAVILKLSGLDLVVSNALRVESYNGQPALVTEWVEGSLASPREVEEVQRKLELVLRRFGLPLWSVTRLNPRAHTNFIRRQRDGVWVLIDFEALLLSPFINDWVDFGQLEREIWKIGLAPADLSQLIDEVRRLQNLAQRRQLWDISRNLFTGS